MAEWYPMMIKLAGRKCVVFGGGPVAQRKAAGLLQAEADVLVVSPGATPDIREWADTGRLRWAEREAEADDLEGAALAFAATGLPEVNRRIAAWAKSRDVPVNVADEGDEGDFLVPAVHRQGDLVLTASSSGAGPALASRIIGELAERYGPEYNEYMKALRTIRTIVKRTVPDPAERRALLRAAATEEALAEWRAAGRPDDAEQVVARLRQRAKHQKG